MLWCTTHSFSNASVNIIPQNSNPSVQQVNNSVVWVYHWPLQLLIERKYPSYVSLHKACDMWHKGPGKWNSHFEENLSNDIVKDSKSLLNVLFQRLVLCESPNRPRFVFLWNSSQTSKGLGHNWRHISVVTSQLDTLIKRIVKVSLNGISGANEV